jgi:hypothetical protein
MTDDWKALPSRIRSALVTILVFTLLGLWAAQWHLGRVYVLTAAVTILVVGSYGVIVTLYLRIRGQLSWAVFWVMTLAWCLIAFVALLLFERSK